MYSAQQQYEPACTPAHPRTGPLCRGTCQSNAIGLMNMCAHAFDGTLDFMIQTIYPVRIRQSHSTNCGLHICIPLIDVVVQHWDQHECALSITNTGDQTRATHELQFIFAFYTHFNHICIMTPPSCIRIL